MSTKSKEFIFLKFLNEINAWFNLIEFACDGRNIMFFGINDLNIVDVSKVVNIVR